MIIETVQRGNDKVFVAYDPSQVGAAAYKDVMVMNGLTGKVTFPQQEDLRLSVSVGTEGANAIDVACQIVDNNGVAVAGAKEVLIRALAVTDSGGDLAAATAAVGTIRKTLNPATGENLQWMVTTNGGAFSFKSTNAAQELTLIVVEIDGARVASFTLNFAAV